MSVAKELKQFCPPRSSDDFRLNSLLHKSFFYGLMEGLFYSSKASLEVPDFATAVVGSSCDSLFFCSYSPLFSFPNYFCHPILSWECLRLINIKEKQRNENEAKNEIISWTAVHRDDIISDYHGPLYRIYVFISLRFFSGFAKIILKKQKTTVSTGVSIQLTSIVFNFTLLLI